MSGLNETQKKWGKAEDKALTECLKFLDSPSDEVGDRVKLSVQLLKEAIKNKQNILHEKVYELAARRTLGAASNQPKLPALKAS